MTTTTIHPPKVMVVSDVDPMSFPLGEKETDNIAPTRWKSIWKSFGLVYFLPEGRSTGMAGIPDKSNSSLSPALERLWQWFRVNNMKSPSEEGPLPQEICRGGTSVLPSCLGIPHNG